MLIRDTTVADLPQIDLVRQANEPWHVTNHEAQANWFRRAKPESKPHRICAEIDGRVIANGAVKLDLYAASPGSAVIAVNVHPDHQGQGIGGKLHARLEEHLRAVGAEQALGQIIQTPRSVAFAEKHGYSFGATDHYIVVDPRELPPIPGTPQGVTVTTAAEAGPEAWYAVVDIAARDEPMDVPFNGMPYDDWFRTHWVSFDKDISLIAFVDGKPAATTALNANYDTGRASSAGSDALREYRGRGIVKLIKSLSLRAAAQRGITAAFTANNETNAPMRAINAWLGYRYVGTTRTAFKEL